MKRANWIACLSLILSQPVLAHDKQVVEAEARKAAAKFGLDADLYVAIVRVESGLYAGAYNKQTHDYGAAQVNKKTAQLYGFNLHLLKTDLKYNLEAGAKILADFKQTWPETYICRYNVGSGRLIGKRLSNCLKYKSKVFKEYDDIVNSKTK